MSQQLLLDGFEGERLGKVNQAVIVNHLAAFRIKKVRYVHGMFQYVGDYDLQKIDAYTFRLIPSPLSIHDADDYLIYFSRDFLAMKDSDDERCVIIRQTENAARARLEKLAQALMEC